jgi:hypothetical protein
MNNYPLETLDEFDDDGTIVENVETLSKSVRNAFCEE